MENKKFETLIDLIINENEEQARELFHEIVVEKSREIYESIMDEEAMAEEDDMPPVEEALDMEEDMGGMEANEMTGQVEGLLDEINAEESGVVEAEDEEEFDLDVDADEMGDEEGMGDEGGEVEDAVIRIEDKLDQLMAEFEEIMAGKEGDEEDMGDEEGEEDMAGEEDMEEDVMENVQLQKVSVTHGDNGAFTKNPNNNNSGQAGMDSKPVKFSGAAETVPTSPKGPSNAYSKGEGNLPGAGNFKNAPKKGNFSDKGESTPKPVAKDGASYTKSPVAK